MTLENSDSLQMGENVKELNTSGCLLVINFFFFFFFLWSFNDF